MRIHSQEQIAFSMNRAQRNTTQIEKSLLKLGSGLKIAKGSDNASGLSISETMRAQIRGISRAQANMQDGLSVLEASNEGLNNVNGLLQRARELAVQSANGTLTESDRKAGQQELDHLLGAIDDTATKLEFNTKKILGEKTQMNLHVGANPGQNMKIDLMDVSTAALGIEGASILTQTNSAKLITTIDGAIKTISGHLTKVGSQMEAVEHHLTNALVFENNLTKSLSLLEDTDMAQEMMNFINLDIRQKGDHLLVNSVNQNVQNVLNLLSK
ncbi:flagellin [Sporosarcina sp. Te-1]|uniref:flagellin N-terminal helical domain-containing protein n=1 Tax=Sporosarcina sp. Te-1 TaxID=2818390 RepID=UPI001A9F1FE1|nr:flagellin [Sporosarcina sp. Te-1]QTD41169.1 flagellin [Sporosarcina sp. Te-1]